MKVKNFNEFVNESSMTVTRTITNGVDVSVSKIRCVWDGERWCYFDTNGKKSLEEFKSLERNRNTNFDVSMVVGFSLLDEDGDYEDDICDVPVTVRLHYYNMVEDDYDIRVIEIGKTNNLAAFVKSCYDSDGFSFQDFRKTLEQTWREKYVDDEILNELEDNLGQQEYSKILDGMRNAVVDVICAECGYNERR